MWYNKLKENNENENEKFYCENLSNEDYERTFYCAIKPGNVRDIFPRRNFNLN